MACCGASLKEGLEVSMLLRICWANCVDVTRKESQRNLRIPMAESVVGKEVRGLRSMDIH